MALNIKNQKVEALVDDVVKKTGETKTQAILKALEERKERLSFQVAPARDRGAELEEFLENEIWSKIPKRLLGKSLPKAKEDEILGYGPDGF